MSDLYTLTTPGTVPVSLATAKSYLKADVVTNDDALITSMLALATRWGERYTGHDFRANTWTLLRDDFEERIELRRSPIDAISSIEYYVGGVLSPVSASTYYLKKKTQFSEILLVDGYDWPTDGDVREQNLQIVFTTTAYPDPDAISTAILQHVAYWYSNRGDNSDIRTRAIETMAQHSGACIIYDQFRIARV